MGEGEIHALLGPNGAGKTTLIRMLTGLVAPTSGTLSVLGLDASRASREMRQLIGLVPSGDRSFYLRISGLENLVFFARLHGLRRKDAVALARSLLDDVGLAGAAGTKVGLYSHGMQKRLAVARALLTDPPVLLIDEATHDLDPPGARRVRELVHAAAGRGTAVVWATQRLEEISGFAETVTLLSRGRVAFAGTVPELVARAESRRFVLHLANGCRGVALESTLVHALGTTGSIRASGDAFVLTVPRTATLGDALVRIADAGVEILSCDAHGSALEDAFVSISEAGE